jgi:hypothetical protein
LSADGTVLPRNETPRSAQTLMFGVSTSEEAAAARAAARAAVLSAPPKPAPPERGRRVWLWVLAPVALVAIVSSTMMRLSREGREQRYAQAQLDSARRADSLRKLDSARADSVGSATLVGGMVDSAKLAEQAKDSLERMRGRALQAGVVAAIRRYTDAIQRGDLAAARAAFPRVEEAELSRWQTALERYTLRFRVEPPQQIALSDRDLVADTDVALVVQYVDKTTREVISTNRLPRHATLTKQGQRWQLDALKQR